MTTLTPTEAAILEQLREKPMDADKMREKFYNLSPDRWVSTIKLLNRCLFLRVKTYHQMWRDYRSSSTLHLTHEGRLALIAWEKEQQPKTKETKAL